MALFSSDRMTERALQQTDIRNRQLGAESIYRAVTALALGKALENGEERYLRRFADDRVALATRNVLKAATTPATMASMGGTLAESALGDFFASLGPQSAASQLMGLSLNLGLPDGENRLTVPALQTEPVSGGFVAEGEPGKVLAKSLLGDPIVPKKVLILSAVTRELAKRANGETIIRRALRSDASLIFDAALFSDDDVSSAAPAGLLFDVTPTPSSGGADDEGMRRDLVALASAVAPVAGGVIAFIASPEMAVRIALAPREFAYPVFPSSALAAGTVAAVAPAALAFAVNPVPDIDVSAEAVLHMDDDPDPIVSAGSPGTTAAPVRSMFQTDCLAIRLIADLSWQKLHEDAVAYMEGIGW